MKLQSKDFAASVKNFRFYFFLSIIFFLFFAKKRLAKPEQKLFVIPENSTCDRRIVYNKLAGLLFIEMKKKIESRAFPCADRATFSPNL